MKKVFSIVLCIAMLLALLPTFATAAEIVDSGYCGGEGDGKNLTWTLDSDGTLTISGTGAMKDYSYPSSYSSGIPCTTAPWGNSAEKAQHLKTVVIEPGVTRIGEYAFLSCTSLTSVTIPDSVTSIGSYAFNNCTSLTSVSIPDSVTSIGNGVFFYCTGLISVTIPDSVTSIGYNAFRQCESLVSISIPNSVTSIGNAAFGDCTSLTSFTIPDGVTSIGISMFRRCKSLTSIELPISIEQVLSSAFTDCTGLASIYFFNPNCSIVAGALPTNTMIYGYAGSTAQTYAYENGLFFMEIEEIDEHEHQYTVTKEVLPTCTEDGYRSLACPCGERMTEVLPATGHTPAAATETVVAEATCGRPGGKLVTVKCAVCGETLSEETVAIPATGEHTPGEATETVVREAACTAAGEKRVTVKCAVCGVTISEATTEIPATGHEYSMTVTAPTCTASGYTTYTCAHGDSQFIRDLVDPLGHADANADGKCDRCGATLTPGENPGGNSGDSGNSGGSGRQSFFNSLWAFILNLLNMLGSLFGR